MFVDGKYITHNSKAMVAPGQERNDTVYQKTLAVNDFYLAGGGREWPLGNIQMLGKSNAEASISPTCWAELVRGTTPLDLAGK